MNKKQFLAAAVLVLGVGGASCNSSRKMTAGGPKGDCNYATAGAVTMTLTAEPVSAVSGTNLPKSYTVLRAGNEKAFFKTVRKEGGTAAFQLPSGCRQFKLSLSETMSPQMAERYPDLVSLKGVSEDGTDLRLDWDGTVMRGQILEAGKSFLLEPQAAGSGNVYILFNKADVTLSPRVFETTSPAAEKIQRRRDAEK